MKSEHRHELAENDLAKYITRALKKIEPYQNQILLGMLVITVVIVSAVLLTRSTSADKSGGFAALVNCETADDYKGVAEQFPGTIAGHWARLRSGEKFLQEGIRLSISDRAQATDRLEEAEEAFDKLLQDQTVNSEVRLKALYGMAMTLESLGDDTAKSIAAYQALIDEFPDSRYRPLADERIADLEKGSTQEFYAWFQAQNPSPTDRPLPRDFPNPFDGMFDDDDEVGGLPPPPPPAQRAAANAAPDPPEDGGEGEGPALSAPGATESDESAPQADTTTTDDSPGAADDSEP